MLYFIKRKYNNIKNIIKWLPILWNQFDFHYIYAIDVFKFKLLNIANHLESNNANCLYAKHKASRIHTIIRLMEKSI